MFKLTMLGVYIVGIVLWSGVLALYLTRPSAAPVHPSRVQATAMSSATGARAAGAEHETDVYPPGWLLGHRWREDPALLPADAAGNWGARLSHT
jgi:hypothetical protein